MQFLSRRASELLDKLLIVAGGDLDLVMEAIHAAAARNGGTAAPLGAVLDLICSRRTNVDKNAVKRLPSAA